MTKSLNQVYLAYLSKYPLLTKSITSGILYGLNESIASGVAKDYGQYRSKAIKMVIYGSLILTPISHTLYGVLNSVFSASAGGKPLSFVMKCLQIVSSLLTITPILSGIFTSWVSLNNIYKPEISLKKGVDKQSIVKELQNMVYSIKVGLKANYGKFLKSSVITNFSCLVIAQNFLPPELWVVFFNLVYFVLGTSQNIKVKMASKGKEEELRPVVSEQGSPE